VIAGPRILEHMVDTVLYFESDPAAASAWCARSRTASARPTRSACSPWRSRACGRCATHPRCSCRGPRWPCRAAWSRVVREGSRPLLVELQALVDEAAGLSPRRVAVGFEGGRLALLLAVLHRHGGIATAGQDVFVNVGAACASARPRRTCRRCSPCCRACATGRPRTTRCASASWAHRRGPPGTVRRGTAARGGEAGLPARAGAAGERAAPRDRRHRGERCVAPRAGVNGGLLTPRAPLLPG